MFCTFPSCSQISIVFYHSVIHGLGLLYGYIPNETKWSYNLYSMQRKSLWTLGVAFLKGLLTRGMCRHSQLVRLQVQEMFDLAVVDAYFITSILLTILIFFFLYFNNIYWLSVLRTIHYTHLLPYYTHLHTLTYKHTHTPSSSSFLHLIFTDTYQMTKVLRY